MLLDSPVNVLSLELTNEKQGDVMLPHFRWSVHKLTITLTVKALYVQHTSLFILLLLLSVSPLVWLDGKPRPFRVRVKEPPGVQPVHLWYVSQGSI